MAFLRIEQETIINFNEAEDEVDLYTSSPVMIRKMDKLVEENPEQFRSKVHSKYKGEICGMKYYFPKRFVCIRSKDVKRNMTEEQREQAREQLRKNRVKNY